MDEASVITKKKKRNLPGTPDPDAEVIALSPRTLMATNRFSCDVCGKGFQRDQNLQLHRRGHNLPWKLKQREGLEVKKKVYVCPEILCVHHDPSRALGDLTGIKKHFSRKHGEKKWKCEKCSKSYAVQSDWKAHKKVCGTREYRCDCGTLFSRRDSFITHRAFCGALAEENAKSTSHKKAESQESGGGWDENTPPSARTREFSSTFDAPSTPSQVISSPSNMDIGEPPIKESCKSPFVKEGFKQASTKENFKPCSIKQTSELDSVEETFKQSPLKEDLEEPTCALDESGISSLSPKWIQDGRDAQPYKTNEVGIRILNCELDDIGMSTMSPKWLQNNVGNRSDKPTRLDFKQSNSTFDEKLTSSSSPKWIEDSVTTQTYRPSRNFKQPNSSLDVDQMSLLSVSPKWMQHVMDEKTYKPGRDFRQPNYALDDSGIPSVSPKWIQDGVREQVDKPNKGPTPLSLRLGCGPSPSESPKSNRDKPIEEMNHVTKVSLTENKDRNQWSLLSHGSGTFTTVLNSSSNSNNNDTKLSEPHHYVGSHTNSSVVETLAYGSTIGSQSYFSGNPSKPSNHHHHHRYNTTKGQMPATALLQKAAMMGATSSNRYLLRNFGLRGSSTLSNMVSGGSGQDTCMGPTFSSMWNGGFTTFVSTSGAQNLDRSSHENGTYTQVSLYDDRKTRIQGFSKASSLSANFDSPMDDVHGHDHMLLFGVSKVPNNSTILAGLEGLQRADKHEGDRTTLDLLGVGSYGMGVEEKSFSY